MSKLVLVIHKIAFKLDQSGVPCFPRLIIKIFIRLIFGCQLGVGTKFGVNVDLGYGGLGVVIHERAIIGNNVRIGTGVTIGGTTEKYEVPVIGDNTIVSTGVKVLGPVKIGRNCVIGANAVVLESIPDNCVAVGIPARIIKKNIQIEDYRSMV